MIKAYLLQSGSEYVEVYRDPTGASLWTELRRSERGFPEPGQDMVTIEGHEYKAVWLQRILIPENDLGQIIDGLTCRAEEYRNTSEALRGITTYGTVHDVTDDEEADRIALWYETIIDQLQEQRART